MNYVLALVLLFPISASARIHTVLDSNTIANFQKTKITTTHHSQYSNIINNAANKYDVDVRLIHAIIQNESAYNPTAVSNKGAIGIMQLIPDTAARFGVVDIYNPKQNIDGGTKYLKFLIELFNSNITLVVAAYNAGENAVIRYNYKVPPYPETKNYVKQVMTVYNQS